MRKHYITPQDDYTDAHVASLLCDGGPIKYELQDGLNLTDNFLFTECIPNIRARYSEDYRLCKLLGLAYMWAVFDEDASEFVGAVVRDRIQTQYGRQYTCPTNPVKKVPIHIVKGINDKLDIVEGAVPPEARAPVQGGGVAAAAQVQAQYGIITNAQLLAYLQRMERRQEENISQNKADVAQLRSWLGDQVNLIIENQRRYGGTIGQALARQDPGRQRRNAEHQEARRRQQQQQQQPQQNRQQAPRQQQQQARAVPAALGARQQQLETPGVARLLANPAPPAPRGPPRPPPRQMNTTALPTARFDISPRARLIERPKGLRGLWEEHTNLALERTSLPRVLMVTR